MIFQCLVTNTGLQAIRDAEADGVHLPLVSLAVGDLTDAQYSNDALLTGGETALHNEKYRAAVHSIFADPEDANAWIIRTHIASPTGNWHIREFGLFDDSGRMIVVGKHPEIYIPDPAELGGGMMVDDIIEIKMTVSNETLYDLLWNISAHLATEEFVLRIQLGSEAACSERILENAERIGLINGWIATH